MSIDFRSFAVGLLETNCYLIWDRDSLEGAVIDPGGGFDKIASSITSLGVRVGWVLLTHGHFDHSFHAGSLARRCDARLGMHETDVNLTTESLFFSEPFYDAAEFEAFIPTDLLNDGDVVHLGESEIMVLHTPGHSKGGLCFVTDAGVFCGDTIFAGSVGRTDFPGGSMEQLVHSIRTRILTLDDATPLYPGHGPATTVGIERGSNPYL